MKRYNRTASTLITLFGTITNAILTIQVLAAWRSLKWEPESEWESSGNGIKVIWALLFVYFSSAAAVCTVGLVGVIKNKPSHVRFYRDYSIADFSFCTFSTLLATYAAFLGPARAGVCEELSHHPELMRDMLEMGLNLENCERWLERAVFAALAVMFVVMVVRLHFLLAVSNYYSHLVRHRNQHQFLSWWSATQASNPAALSSPSSSSLSTSSTSSSTSSHPLQRIFLLPNKPPIDLENGEVEYVYAPVPRHTLPKEIQEQATEAWVSSNGSVAMAPAPRQRRHHHHHHHHRRRSSSRGSDVTGRIKLEIGPDEGLLPGYEVKV
ncbi:hypothetical protein B0H34DRAFT_780500 [Crassisporium funariophilum]|nr:hypothetical protein B0H34DRAFT_780500 [Crassisporium funariophilum]